MRNPTACSMALLALLFLGGTACSRSEKSKELAALDDAYKAGVLTQDEYQIKKAAIASAAASSAASSSPAPGSPATPASADGHAYRMKQVKIMDAQGFERPMVSATMLIPTGWQSQAATTWNVKDSCNTVQTTLRASGPDGKAFEIFPAYNWVWADDPTLLRQSAAQQAQFGTRPCDVLPAVGAADFLKQNLGRIRPNVQLGSIEAAPKLLAILQDQAHQAEQMAAQFRLQQKVRPDAVKARLQYTLDGRNVEEWIFVATVVTATLGPSYDPRTLRMTQAYSYNCRANMVAERAPQGQLDSAEKLFELINSTYRVDQTWMGRVQQNAQAVQQIELKGVRDRSNIVTKNAEDIRNIQQQSFENQQRAQQQSANEFSQVIRGVETYQNPGTGERVELDSNYGHAWVNGKGEYLLSDQEGFNPNAVTQESWTALQHVKP